MLNRSFGIMTSFAANRLAASEFCSLGQIKGFLLPLFRERLSEKVHATMSIPKGIVGGFELNQFSKEI